MTACRIFIAPVPAYVLQREPEAPNSRATFCEALRSLWRCPGTWDTAGDLTNLAECFSFLLSFKDPRWSALASKLRVIETVAPDAAARSKELRLVHCNFFRRPQGPWHSRCLFSILAGTGNGGGSHSSASDPFCMRSLVCSDERVSSMQPRL